MIVIPVKEGEVIDRALKRFKKKFLKTGTLKQIRSRKEFIKKAKSDAENTKVSIRNVRREGNSQLKEFLKEKEISEDEERQGEEEIQKLTDIYVNKVDEILSFKEKDLLDF